MAISGLKDELSIIPISALFYTLFLTVCQVGPQFNRYRGHTIVLYLKRQKHNILLDVIVSFVDLQC